MTRRKKHGPGWWVCHACLAVVTEHPDWENRMLIPLPAGYRSKGGKCARCERVVPPGARAWKVTDAARVTFGSREPNQV